jgi:hypothetical protein
MRKFIIKFLIFISPILLLILWWEHELARMTNSYETKVRLVEKAAPNCEVLVLGSSHAYFGINPSFFTRKGFNMANTSQSLYYDTEIITRYLPHLPKLKYAVFPVSYFSLEEEMLAQGSESFRCSFYHRFYHLPDERWIDKFDIRNFSSIALYGVPESTRYLRLRFNVNLAEHLASNGWYEVAFDKDDEKNINDASGKTRVDFHNASMAETNIAYNRALLLKAICLCKDAGVVPILITTPVYHTYRDHIDRDKFERMQKVIHGLCIETSVKYFNYFADHRFDVDDFHDNDHLNAQGAEKFSKILDQEVLQNLNEDSSQTQTRP